MTRENLLSQQPRYKNSLWHVVPTSTPKIIRKCSRCDRITSGRHPHVLKSHFIAISTRFLKNYAAYASLHSNISLF